MKIKELFLKNFTEILVVVIGLFFGTFLMFSTFSSDSESIQISAKAWSDFASHVPLIRSFSLGNNFPPEYPLFPGEPIKYHFLFYAFAGILEKIGLPIGLALNVPSALGFVFLILMIYLFAKLIFKSKVIGMLSVFFFLFNSSLSFIYYFRNSPISLTSLKQIPYISDFQSFAPYGNGIVTAFWNLNIYTNQRHLAISFALSFIIIYLFVRPIFSKHQQSVKLSVVLGATLGLSFFLHMAVFLMTSVIIFFISLLFSKVRKFGIILLLVAGLLAIPQYQYLNSSPGFKTIINAGFLIFSDLTFYKFMEFWIYNLGLSIILIPLGFIYSSRNQKKILLAFFSLFFIGNVVQFSPEIAANHKFCNYFIIIGNIFSAYTLYILWRKKQLFRPFVIIIFFFMTFGGIIDFFPIYNDRKISFPDYKINKDSLWILRNTNLDAGFLNTTFLYDPGSLAGRKTL